jgi:hypothetical protein
MPWWAIIYLLVFIAFSIVGDTIGEFDGTKRVRWFANLFAGVTFSVLFAGFWLTPIYHALGFVAPVFLIAAVAWELCSAPFDLREIWTDPELSRRERIGVTLLPTLLVWPLYIVAGVGVWRFYVRA